MGFSKMHSTQVGLVLNLLHQNGAEEPAIKTVVTMSRTMLIHDVEYINVVLDIVTTVLMERSAAPF